MSCRLVACPHPFTTERIERDIEPRPIRDILAEVQPEEALRFARVLINDEIIDESCYDRVPENGDLIIVRIVPQGGGNNTDASTGSKIGGALLFLGGLALTIFTGGLWASIGVSLMMAGASAFVVGTGLKYGWFIPDQGANEIDKQPPSIRGGRNRASPNGDIPMLLGKHLVIPPFGVNPFTTIQGADQYLHELFVLGYGPVEVDESSLRIGETLLSEYSGVSYDIQQDASAIDYIPGTVTQDDINVQIAKDANIVRTTPTGIDRIIVEMAFPSGLFYVNDNGQRSTLHTQYTVQYKPAGDPDASYLTAEAPTIYGSSSSAIRRATTIDVANGQYDVRVTNNAIVSSDDYVHLDLYLSNIKSIANEDPVGTAIRAKVARISLRVKATDQLNGIIDEFNFIAHSVCPDYDGAGSGAGVWTARATSNPASLFLWLLRGPMNPKPAPDAMIDWAALEAWHTWCADNGFECNAYVQQGEPLKSLLNKVAVTGRASPSLRDGKYTVVRDIEKTVPIQHFTPRNSRNFSGKKAFYPIPDVVNLTFVNAEVGYQSDTRPVYNDGFDAASAETAENIDVWGITDPDQIWRHGRYLIASKKLRPEVYTLETDVENIVCTRGDLVRVSHDVPLFGIAAGRIKAVALDVGGNATSIVVDEALAMEAGKNYGVRIRRSDGSQVSADLVTAAGEQTSVTFAAPIAPANVPAAGDLFSFGESGLETVEMLIVGMEMQKDLGARIIIVDYAPGVFTADTGEIPAFDSHVTLPADIPYTPPVPAVVSMRSDGTVLVRQSDGTLQNRILITLYPQSHSLMIDRYEAQWKIAATDETYRSTTAPGNAVEIGLSPVEDLMEYDVRVRAFDQAGIASDWVSQNVIAYGKTAPPQDVPSVLGSVRGVEGIEIKWTAVQDKDLASYELRVGADWASATPLFSGLALTYLWAIQTAATYHLMVKAIDASGNESITEAVTDVVIAAPDSVQSLLAQVVGNTTLVNWAMPLTGSLPIGHYRILKGVTFAGAAGIGSVTGTFFTIAEAVTGDVDYWVVPVDAAGNEGPETSVTANIATIPVAGADVGNVPVLSAEGAYESVILYVDNKGAAYQFQVTDDPDAIPTPEAVTWYSLQFDGTDFKDTADAWTDWPAELLVHPKIPFDFDVDGNGDSYPVGKTLYYRARRTNAAAEISDWSIPVAATTKTGDGANLALNSLTANKFNAVVLNALLANINDRLVIGSSTGYAAYNFAGASLRIGDTRVWADMDEVRVEVVTALGSPNTVDNATWLTVLRSGGQESSRFISSMRAKILANPNADLSSFPLALDENLLQSKVWPSGGAAADIWTLDNTLDDVDDTSTLANSGTSFDATEKPYGSYSLKIAAGTSDYVKTATDVLDFTKDFTFGIRFKLSSTVVTGPYPLFRLRNANYAIGVDMSGLSFIAYPSLRITDPTNGTVEHGPNSGVALNTTTPAGWNMLSISYDASTHEVTIVLNDVETWTYTLTGAEIPTGTAYLYVGFEGAGGSPTSYFAELFYADVVLSIPDLEDHSANADQWSEVVGEMGNDLHIVAGSGGSIYLHGGFIPDGVTYDTDWHYVGGVGEPAFENGWASCGLSPRFRRDTAGNVWIEGCITGGTLLTSCFTLPVGYRPSQNTVFAEDTNSGTHGNVAVTSAGYLVLQKGSTTAAYITCSFNVGGGYPIQGATGETGPKGDKGDAGTGSAMGEYDSGISYGEGQMCNYGGILYKKRAGSGTESGMQPDTHPASWAAISGGNTDWSSVSSDIALEIGETIELPFSSAASVPLYVATEDGTAYEMTMLLSAYVATTAAELRPNNTTYPNKFYCEMLQASSSTPSAQQFNTSSFGYTSAGWLKTGRYTINNSLAQKEVVLMTRIGALNAPATILVTMSWNDMTTAWISIGTMVWGAPQSGTMLLKRTL